MHLGRTVMTGYRAGPGHGERGSRPEQMTGSLVQRKVGLTSRGVPRSRASVGSRRRGGINPVQHTL